MDLTIEGAGRRRPNSTLRLAVAAALLGAASSASAFLDDRLQVVVGETVTHDSNVFRISQSADPQTTIGSSERGDTWYDTSVGVRLDMPISRQRVLASLNWSQIRYDRFTGLNHLDRNGNVNWIWQAGNQWSGQLGYDETHTLAPFTNFAGPLPNPLTTKTLSGTANFLVDPHWELQAIGSDMRQRNTLALRLPNDIDLSTLQVGVNYISNAGNRLGVNVRQEDGRHPNSELVGTLLINNDYVQRSIGASTNWTITGKSHLLASVGHLWRDYDQFSGRNYTGTVFRAAYDWLPTAKTSVSLIGQRDISSSEDVQTAFVLVKGVALTPSYAFSDKLRLSATLSSDIREYLGTSGAPGIASVFAGRVDHVHGGAVSLTYQPMRSLTLALSAHRETRSSNVPLLDYASNLFEISARLTF